MNDYLMFRKFITPAIIQVLFWFLVVVVFLAGVFQILLGLSQPFGGGWTVLVGLLTLVAGPVLVRIWCETLIIFFHMHELLGEIRDLQSKTENLPPPPAA